VGDDFMQNEYLNEQKYQQTKKKISMVSVIILVVGLLLGATLITVGIVKMSAVDKKYELEEATRPSAKSVDEIKAEIAQLENELVSLKAEKSREFDDVGFSEKFYQLENQIKNKTTEINDLKTEIWEIENNFGDYNTKFSETEKSIEKSKNIPFIIFGVFVIIASLMYSGIVMFIAKRREIMAFTVQQTMPVAQEATEKMAPTVGVVAKEIAKGIKEGINEADNNQQ
jgi:flagellar basal body-associated protein FliL